MIQTHEGVQARILADRFQKRQRARTDLHWLMTNVLQYKDIEEAHRPIIDGLQKFTGGIDRVHPETGEFVDYTPFTPLWELQGPRKGLFLCFRAFFKSTIITISHSVQWIINYPDVRIHCGMATGDQVQNKSSAVLGHFRYNEYFRWLFPEFCPPKHKAKDFGSLEGFTVPCRKAKWLQEPTFSTSSQSKAVAGGHYEVMKLSDLVDWSNVQTPNQVRETIEHFKFLNPLVERSSIQPHHGWRDVEGTPYDPSDLYAWIQEDLMPRDDGWKLTFIPALDREGKATWPTRLPLSELQKIEKEDEFVYHSQYLLNPIPPSSGLATREEIKFVPRKIMRSVPMAYHMAVDLAGMEPASRGDFTAVAVGGFDHDGRMNIVHLVCGRFTPFEVIEILFMLSALYPDLIEIKIEKDAHARVLLPFLQREQSKRHRWLPPMVPIQRDNRTSKKQRIKGLQPWFKAGIIRFAEEINCRAELLSEILRFSDVSTYHDDILDTLADLTQSRNGVTGDVFPDEPRPTIPMRFPQDRFLGFDPITQEARWSSDREMQPGTSYDAMTGL